MNKNIVFMFGSIVLFIVGLFGLLMYRKVKNDNEELKKTIENQNMLIEILKKSCEE